MRRGPGSGNDLPGIFYNKNAGDITKWTYDPDFNRPANNSNLSGMINPTLRLTAQLTLRNRLVSSSIREATGSATIPRSAGRAAATERRKQAPSGEAGVSDVSIQMELDGHEPAAAGCELRLVPPELERARSAWQQPRPDSRDRTVLGGLSQQRRRPGSRLPRANWSADYMEPNRWQAGAHTSPARTT